MHAQQAEVLSYWFGDYDSPDYPVEDNEKYWKKNPDIDAEIKAKFSGLLEASARGELADWVDTPRGALAHIILIDQMARNMHRGTGMMHAQDDLAQDIALISVMRGDATFLTQEERVFLYMPFMHAENWALQMLCVRLFEQEAKNATPKFAEGRAQNHKFAIAHEVIVKRFGRFPHRNELLGRVSTPEEIEFLKEDGSSF